MDKEIKIRLGWFVGLLELKEDVLKDDARLRLMELLGYIESVRHLIPSQIKLHSETSYERIKQLEEKKQ